MSVLGLASVLVAIALLPTDLTGTALATCSPSALDAVHTELRDAPAPDCGTKPFESRRFDRSPSAMYTCVARPFGTANANATVPRTFDSFGASGERHLPDAVVFTAAANGTATTTTTSPPGAPTTTTLPTCTMISLEVDRGDCTDVTSEPPGLVECAGSCDVKTFTVPAFGSLQLKGMPAPGDTGVLFGGNCNDDGTVLLGDAALPDCSLSCDCSSTF